MVMCSFARLFGQFFPFNAKKGVIFSKNNGGGRFSKTPDSHLGNFFKKAIGLAKTTTAWYNISEGIFTEVRLESIEI